MAHVTRYSTGFLEEAWHPAVPQLRVAPSLLLVLTRGPARCSRPATVILVKFKNLDFAGTTLTPGTNLTMATEHVTSPNSNTQF